MAKLQSFYTHGFTVIFLIFFYGFKNKKEKWKSIEYLLWHFQAFIRFI
jgi:hypothetical protein